jgi:spore germination cell wall hydrolase CwlJ-like protein
MKHIVEVLRPWACWLLLAVPTALALAAIQVTVASGHRLQQLEQDPVFQQTRERYLDGLVVYQQAPAQARLEPEIDPAELECMAMNVFHEARGESFQGKLAVAHVTMNRVRHEAYPNTICGVVFQAQRDHRGNPIRNRCQFSWHCNGRSDEVPLYDRRGRPLSINKAAWQDSLDASRIAITEDVYDLTHGATHYFNPNLAQPFWSAHYEHVTQIDNHSFYRMVRR